MNTCPKCGASEVIEEGSCDTDFACGSHLKNGNADRFRSGGICNEICQLRERVAWLEKWREVVLHHIEPETLMRFSTGEYIACCKVSIGKTDAKDARTAFDVAVRKEME